MGDFMKRFLTAISILALSFTLLTPLQARAMDEGDIGQGFAQPTYEEMIQSVIILGGLDINDNAVADEYGKMIYCDVFKKNYKNDFEWNNIRRQIVSRVLEKKELFRLQYEIYGEVNLGRYDFANQIFPLTEETQLIGIGSLSVFDFGRFEPYCKGGPKTRGEPLFPRGINLNLNQKLMLEGLKMPMEEAEQLLKTMQEMEIKNRKLYTRFRVRLMDIPRMTKDLQKTRNISVMVGAQVLAIDFFLDPELSMKVASINPMLR